MRGEWGRRPPPKPEHPHLARVPTRAVAELKATALLAKASIGLPPVSVALCADAAGIALVSYGTLSGEISALLMKIPGGPVGIVVNERHALVRRRFSIAHEIGHWVLERVPETKELAPVAARGRQYGAVERVCNYFAACLLMPANWIRERTDGGMTNAELAKAFEVSPQALVHRLGELGYYTRGGPR